MNKTQNICARIYTSMLVHKLANPSWNRLQLLLRCHDIRGYCCAPTRGFTHDKRIVYMTCGKSYYFFIHFINKGLSVQDVLVHLMSSLSTYHALGWADNEENVPHVCVY